MALFDLTDKKNFKIFFVVDIVITLLLTGLNFFILPFCGWMFGDGESVYVLLLVSLLLALVLFIVWLVMFLMGKKNDRQHNIQWLLVVALSLGVTFGVHELILVSSEIGKDPYCTFANRWGKCLVESNHCYNMFGIIVFDGDGVYRVYDEHGQKKIIRFFESKGELDVLDFYGEDIEVTWSKMEIWEYNIYGKFDGKVNTKNICKWFRIPHSFMSEYDLDGEYFYDHRFYNKRALTKVVIDDSKDMLINEGFIFE